jgi:hypothetical protein
MSAARTIPSTIQRPPAIPRSLHRRALHQLRRHRGLASRPVPRARLRGTDVTVRKTRGDAAIEEENRTIRSQGKQHLPRLLIVVA